MISVVLGGCPEGKQTDPNHEPLPYTRRAQRRGTVEHPVEESVEESLEKNNKITKTATHLQCCDLSYPQALSVLRHFVLSMCSQVIN